MRISVPTSKAEHAWSANHPLYARALELFADPKTTGIQVMSVQPMLHYFDAASTTVIDHFGFVDGISQPRLDQDGDPTKGEWTAPARGLLWPFISTGPSCDTPM